MQHKAFTVAMYTAMAALTRHSAILHVLLRVLWPVSRRPQCDYSPPRLITSTETNGWKAYNVLPCVLDKWCCRDASDQSNCCNNDTSLLDSDQTTYFGSFIDNVVPGTSTSITSNDSATATAKVTSIITDTASDDSNVSNTATVVGAAVGAVLGLACIIALAGLLWMMRRVKSLRNEMGALRSQESYSASSSSAPMTQHPYTALLSEAPSQHVHEADWNNGRYEIDDTSK